MTDKEKILAEIERLKDKGKYSDTYDYAFRDGNNSALDAIARFINSLPEEPVSEDLEVASMQYGEELDNILAVGVEDDNSVGEYAQEAFKAGAQWQHKQLEKNRLAACDRQTKEEAEREQDFVDKILLGEHRQPTFSDAIEYGAQWQKGVDIKNACEWLYDNLYTATDVECPSRHHVESVVGLGIISQTEFVEEFKKYMKEG